VPPQFAPRMLEELHPELPGELSDVLERQEDALQPPVPRYEDDFVPAHEAGHITPELADSCDLHLSHSTLNVYTFKVLPRTTM